MTELDNKSLQLMGLDSERASYLIFQLKQFTETFFKEWYHHDFKLHQKDQLGNSMYARESKKWQELLSLVKPTELKNNGVGQIFFVIWNSSLGTMVSGERVPAQIWIARGDSVSGERWNKGLDITYAYVGDLMPSGINLFKKPILEMGNIYFNSPVILNPESWNKVVTI